MQDYLLSATQHPGPLLNKKSLCRPVPDRCGHLDPLCLPRDVLASLFPGTSSQPREYRSSPLLRGSYRIKHVFSSTGSPYSTCSWTPRSLYCPVHLFPIDMIRGCFCSCFRVPQWLSKCHSNACVSDSLLHSNRSIVSRKLESPSPLDALWTVSGIKARYLGT